MSFNAKINELLKEKKMTKASLAKEAGIPYTTLDSMLKRDSETARLISIFRIADALGTSLEELVFDGGRNFGGKAISEAFAMNEEEKRMLSLYSLLDARGRETAISVMEKEAEHSIKLKEKKNRKERRITVFDSPAAAGTGLYLQNEDKMEEMHCNVPAETKFGIRIKGDSMEPLIKNGEICFISDEEIHSGDIGIFILNGESLCKKLIIGEKESCLESVNPKYPPIKLLDTDEVKCVGKVIGNEGGTI